LDEISFLESWCGNSPINVITCVSAEAFLQPLLPKSPGHSFVKNALFNVPFDVSDVKVPPKSNNQASHW
jgi:hypothetical protein